MSESTPLLPPILSTPECTPVTPVQDANRNSASSSSDQTPNLLLPNGLPAHDNFISARLLADEDKLGPRTIKYSNTQSCLLLATIVCALRELPLRVIAWVFLRPWNGNLIWSLLSRRATLYMLFLFTIVHFAVIPIRLYVVAQWLSKMISFFGVGTPLMLHCSHCGVLLNISNFSFWKVYIPFEITLYVVRCVHLLIYYELPSCVAGATKMCIPSFMELLRTLRLVDEDEIRRRAWPDRIDFTISKSIEKGVSGPYNIRSVTPQDIVTGLPSHAGSIESNPVIFALSYNHDLRDPYGKTLSAEAAGALCNLLRGLNLKTENVYLWSDITLNKTAFGRDSGGDEMLMPYIAYPTVRLGSQETYWTEVEVDIALSRNALSNPEDILPFTRELIARRRYRDQDERGQVNTLLWRMRALALGMRPEREMSGLQRAIYASLLVGPALNKPIMRKELPGRWDGASEFVDEANGLRDNELQYLKTAMSPRIRMFVLEKDRTSFAVFLYKDDFGDCVVVCAEMEIEADGSYLVRRKVRLIPSANEQRRLVDLHDSPTLEMSRPLMVGLLEETGIYVNLKNVCTQRVDHERVAIR